MHTKGNIHACRLLAVVMLFGMTVCAYAQNSAFDFISKNRNFSASNYCIYPDSVLKKLTPSPRGKKPFYISHYGRHGSRYLSQRKGYDIPLRILAKGDSLGKLTPTGKDVMRQIQKIIDDSEGHWGDLTDLGKQQHKGIARRMMKRFPEVFEGSARVDARSTTVNRCILSMGSALQALVSRNPKLQITMDASKHDMWYMNHQDKQLRDSMMNHAAKVAFQEYSETRKHNERLMRVLFNDSVYVRDSVNDADLLYYVMKTALIQQNTRMHWQTDLIELFTYEEIHQFWQMENAWWYFMYGPSLLNGGNQPYTQRYLLRRIIEEADSCIRLKKPGAQLRFGHETIILPLTCLLGINDFGYQTADLNELEEHGWWACLVFPMASNIQLIFYREDVFDEDVLVKVLLNENEATLPLPTDDAPYYHWRDFREYYLKKIADYERLEPDPKMKPE